MMSFSTGDHEARDIARRPGVAPAAVAFVLLERGATHDDRTDAVHE